MPTPVTAVCIECSRSFQREHGRGRPTVTCGSQQCREIRRLRQAADACRRRAEALAQGLCPKCGAPLERRQPLQ
jgi:hypothetical protein